METKLQQLISTLKKHGMESAEEASRQLIEKAEQRAKEILAEARSEAKAIIARARDEAEKSHRQLRSSLEIAATQMLTDLKWVIEENLLVLPLKDKLSEDLDETLFLKELMTTCVREYMKQPEQVDLTLLVSSEQQEKLADFTMELIKALPGKREGKRLTLQLQSNGVSFGFIIGTTDGVVRLDFTDEAFLDLFLKYLLPRFHGLFKPIDMKGLGNK